MQTQTVTTVVVDAMGGDYAPQAPIKGAVEALKKQDNLRVILVGVEEILRKELSAYEYPKDRLEIVHASQIIATGEPPVAAVRRKKDSSIVVGQKLVKEGKADAFVSAGSTGAVLVGGQLIIGRIRGIDRTPIAVLMPTVRGVSMLIDSGANVDARSGHLVQFAKMGSIYMENVLGVENPKVGLVNIGAEEEKGNALVKETFPLLKECKDIHFIGNVEARDIPFGEADVIVCDAFVGNVILKLYEGTASALLHLIKKSLMSSLPTKIGGALIKPALKETLGKLDTAENGGAPLLGLNGLIVKTHGTAKEAEFCNTIIQCIALNEQDIVSKIKKIME